MLKGMYAAAAGMASQMVLTDINANNLANVSTPGFKTVNVQFEPFGTVMLNRIGRSQEQALGTYAQGAQVYQSVTDFRPGDTFQTGNPLDLAIHGDGFFMIRGEDNSGLMYTRSGNFTRNEEGYVVASDGAHLQGEGGDIQIPKEAARIEINRNGDVLADGKNVGRIKIVQFDNPNTLERNGYNTFKTTSTPNVDVKNTFIEQGVLERSNANVITELVSSMTGVRMYELLQKSIQMQNETLGKAVNEVGRV